MIRFTVIALFLASLAVSMTGCTNTVRGLGQDLNSPALENYNTRTATDY